MANSVLKQGEEYIRKRKKQKRWLIGSLCVAVVAASGTIAALMLNGHALNHTKRVLNCQLQVHEHKTECKDAEGNLICGFADYVVHQHNDDCYDEEGLLSCRLPQVEAHTHEEACYQEEKLLVCEIQETPGHTHTGECYGKGEEEGQEEPVLICTQEETEGHQHTDSCYQIRKVLACGKLELHTHDEKLCYEERGEGEEKERILICPIPVLEEHIHGEECFEVVELSGEEVEDLNQASKEDPAQDTEENGDAEDADGPKEEGEAEGDTGTEEDAVAEGGTGTEEDTLPTEQEGLAEETEGQEEPGNLLTKIYEDESIKVTASYDASAMIPEEAELVVKPVTEEEQDPLQMAEAEELLPEEGTRAKLLYTIGFYLDGQEIEPQGKVTITIQLPQGQEIADGAPVTVIHFGEEGPEVIEGTDVATDEEGSMQTSFDSQGFSDFLIVIGEPEPSEEPGAAEEEEPEEGNELEDGAGEPAGTREVSYDLSDSFPYETEDFLLTLRVVGTATAHVPVEEGEEHKFGTGVAPGADSEDGQDAEAGASPDAKAGTSQDTGAGQDTEADAEEQFEGGSLKTAENQPGEASGEEQIQELDAKDVTLQLSFLESEEEPYQEVMEFIRKGDASSKLLDLSVMRFELMYEDIPLDVTDCTVTAEVALKERVAENSVEEASADGEEADDAGDSADGEGTDDAGDSAETEEDGAGEAGDDAIIVSLIRETDSGYEMADSRSLTAENVELAVMKAEGIEGDVLAVSYTAGEGPEYIVQYYANLETIQTKPGFVNTDTEKTIGLIDTSKDAVEGREGPVLPVNGVLPTFKYISLVPTEGGKYVVETQTTLTKIFGDETYEFYKAQDLKNVNILFENKSYTMTEVWVLQEGKNPESTNPADWNVYKDPSAVKFSNSGSASSDSSTVQIKRGTVIRLIYNTVNGFYNNAAMFYDYDITDGNIYTSPKFTEASKEKTSAQSSGKKYYANTVKQGINSDANYNNGGAHLAFGNANSGTTLDTVEWNGQTLNATNAKNNGYTSTPQNRGQGSTFGIVTGLTGSNGILQYAEGISAPKLFDDGAAIGKTTIDNWSLNFIREGDTYTFTSVQGAGASASNLHLFNNPVTNGKTYTHIFTNNFWPMDRASTFGADGHDLKFGDYNLRQNRHFGQQDNGNDLMLPRSDDGADHNSYFGMQYAFKFNYTETYCGPLEYYFFGDDDMWVFLDGDLICDIGGVHSSNGEYVNLWDYLDAGDAGEHILKVFYTERGASGSTCYMRFTLPSVSSIAPVTQTGNLRIAKEVDGPDAGNKDFTFNLYFDAKNQNQYPYDIVKADGTITSGYLRSQENHTIHLKQDEYIDVKCLPINTKYTVTEAEENGYRTTISVNGAGEISSNTAEGSVPNGSVVVKYTNHTNYELPKTGSLGKLSFTFCGIAVAAAGLMYGCRWKRKRERRYQ